jgi:hypothetical protein
MTHRFTLQRVALDAAHHLELDGATISIVYVADGNLTIHAGERTRSVAGDEAVLLRDAATVRAASAAAALALWRLSRAGETAATPVPSLGASPGIDPDAIVAEELSLTRGGRYVVRCDRVDFPLGGIAYTHVHRGPGIRYLLRGELLVRTGDRQLRIAPGGGWFESGPEPVFAAASETELTSFVRVMVLPEEVLGTSSIRYVDPADADKPKTQRYRVFIDEVVSV